MLNEGLSIQVEASRLEPVEYSPAFFRTSLHRSLRPAARSPPRCTLIAGILRIMKVDLLGGIR